MTLPKGYFGGYSGNNGFNARSLKNWEVYQTARQEMRMNKKANDYNFIDCLIEENKLFNLFIQRFKWDNLPCPDYYLEQSLLFNGIVVGFKDSDYGDMILPATIIERNVYDEPIIVSAIGRNFNRTIELGDEAVLLYDNPLFVPPYLHLSRVAQILGDLNRTCEVYSKGLKKPLYFHATADTARSIKIAAERTLGNEEYTVLETIDDKPKDEKGKLAQIDPSTANIQQFNTPHTALELKGIFDHKQAYCADALANYGIRGAAGADKMAQTNDTEIETANTSASTQFNAALELRKMFCKRLNKFFFKKISVNSMIPDEDESDESDKSDDKSDKKESDNKQEKERNSDA